MNKWKKNRFALVYLGLVLEWRFVKIEKSDIIDLKLCHSSWSWRSERCPWSDWKVIRHRFGLWSKRQISLCALIRSSRWGVLDEQQIIPMFPNLIWKRKPRVSVERQHKYRFSDCLLWCIEKERWTTCEQLEVSAGRHVFDKSYQAITLALAAAGCGRKCISTEQDKMRSDVALTRVCKIYSSIMDLVLLKGAAQRIELCDIVRRLYDYDTYVSNHRCVWESDETCSVQGSGLPKVPQENECVEASRCVVAHGPPVYYLKNRKRSYKRTKPLRLRTTFSGPLLEDDDGMYQIEINGKITPKIIYNEISCLS